MLRTRQKGEGMKKKYSEKSHEEIMKDITDKLEKGVQEIFESESYKNYLKCMSKFHNYSLNNTILIAMQRPDATLVAGYQSWQKNHGRFVKKGEKGIKILAPTPYKVKMEKEKKDPISGQTIIGSDGKPEKETIEVDRASFRIATVFDVSQTEGKELPSIAVNELTGNVEGFDRILDALKESSPVPISFDDISSSAKGYFNTEENRIAVQKNMSQLQTVKTLIHEIAHAKLHSIDYKDIADKDNVFPKDRNTKEVEAESVAYTVCQHYGIDTSDYSFGYIAGWSSGKEMKELKSSLDTIKTAASELIREIDTRLEREEKISVIRILHEQKDKVPAITSGQKKPEMAPVL